MKRNARRQVFTLFICCVTLGLVVSSCIKNKCGTVICNNGGVCVNGICACPVGYEGAFCDTGWQEKFIGVWQAGDTYIRDTNNVHFDYTLSVTGMPDSFMIHGLSDTLEGVVCKRASKYEFTIKPNQVMRVDSSIIIRSGEGKIANGTITGLYSFKYYDTTISVKFAWTR